MKQINELKKQLNEELSLKELSDDEIIEYIYMLLENISGLELLNESALQKIVLAIKN